MDPVQDGDLKGGGPGSTRFTFWHMMFRMVCNMAWHIDISDLSVFRLLEPGTP